MVFWVTAFLDFPADEFDSEVAFWSDVTGYAVSPARGGNGEFATLMPPDGDAFLRVQRLADGPSRIHVDLHVDDPSTAAQRAVELGAEVVGQPDPGHVVVLSSPGGFTFCFVREPDVVRPLPGVWTGDSWSIFDQVCFDIPADRYETECAFWAALTGWELRRSPVAEEFGFVVRPRGCPIRILLQRLGDRDGRVRAHPRPGLLRPSDRDWPACRARCGAGPGARTVDCAAQSRRIGVLPHRPQPEDWVARLNLDGWACPNQLASA